MFIGDNELTIQNIQKIQKIEQLIPNELNEQQKKDCKIVCKILHLSQTRQDSDFFAWF